MHVSHRWEAYHICISLGGIARETSEDAQQKKENVAAQIKHLPCKVTTFSYPRGLKTNHAQW
jgi:hypothetical protein